MIHDFFKAIVLIFCFILTSCGGGGGGGNNTPAPAPAPIPELPSDITGTSIAATAINIDSDINDPNALFVDNNSFATAQTISDQFVVTGYTTFNPTGKENDTFEINTDIDDYYFVTLSEKKVIRLQAVDFDSTVPPSNNNYVDLDLLLFNEDEELISFSTEGDTEFEEIMVPEDGNYYINVNSFSGASSYILTLVDHPGHSSSTIQSLNFVPGEAIVSMTSTPVAQIQRSSKMMGSITLSNSGIKNPARARFDISSVASTFSRKMLSYNDQNSVVFNQLETLKHIKRLRRTKEISSIEPNYLRSAKVVPNDPEYSEQKWIFDSLNLQAAWDVSTGTPALGDVVVAVIDSGVFLNHEDLNDKLLPGYDFISDEDISGDGDGIDDDPNDPGDLVNPESSFWHGTGIAGIIAAETNNNTMISGVSWGAKIMPVRVMANDGMASVYDIFQGILFAVGLENDSGTVPLQTADIINLSFGGDIASTFEKNYLDFIESLGILIVASAGNEGTDSPIYPAGYSSVISVNAVDSNESLTYYSNYGATVDIAAPGGDSSKDLGQPGSAGDLIVIASADGTVLPVQSEVSFGEGTSLSAPHVSGVLALMKAIYPSLSPQDVQHLLRAGELTRDIGASGFDTSFGYGHLDALKAVQAAANLAAGNPLPDLPQSQIILSSTMLNLDDKSTFDYVSIMNKGGGSISLDSIQSNATWLTVSPLLTLDSSGVDIYVDRTGVPLGTYNETVTLTLNSTRQLTFSVSMSVERLATPGDIGKVYGALVSSIGSANSTPATDIQSVSINESSFKFDEVQPGEYYLYLGSDSDNDGIICEVGEICGSYPTLTNPGLISIGNGNDVNLDDIYLQVVRNPLAIPGGIPGVQR